MENTTQDKTAITEALENYYFKGIYEGNLICTRYIIRHAATWCVKGQPYAKHLISISTALKTAKSKRFGVTIQR
jgi:hypothetical protein